jgi:hypothetical protein
LNEEKELSLQEQQRLEKEKQHQHQSALSKIAKLKQNIKEMKDTNDFLTEQVNNLNTQIFEYSSCKDGAPVRRGKFNKNLLECSLFEVDDISSSQTKSITEITTTTDTKFDVETPARDKSLMSSVTASSRRLFSSLHKEELNVADFSVRTDAINGFTPNNSNLASIPQTPATNPKKQSQCAQQ